MAFFPFFIEITDKTALIVGGGRLALEKVRALLPFGVKIHLVSFEIKEEIRQLANEYPEQIILEQRCFQEADLENAYFIIAADNPAVFNHQITNMCRQRKILINTVDQKEDCDFYFPAVAKQGELVAGISSGGKSPLLASYFRSKIEAEMTPFYAELNDWFGAHRAEIYRKIHSPKNRKLCFTDLASLAEEKRCLPTEEEFQEILLLYRH